jgi:hypothetical protein
MHSVTGITIGQKFDHKHRGYCIVYPTNVSDLMPYDVCFGATIPMACFGYEVVRIRRMTGSGLVMKCICMKINSKRIALLALSVAGVLFAQLGGLHSSLAQTSVKRYLPAVMREFPAPPTIFGVGVNNAESIASLKELGAVWTRLPGLNWQDVEPTEGARNWSAVQTFEDDIKAHTAQGIKVILIIQRAPTWARKIPTSACGPVNPAKYVAMGKFIEDAIRRYAVAPFNIEYFEFWNEPDAPQPGGAPPNDGFGCWGLDSDPLFNGREYGSALKVAYEASKRANPTVKVLNGGLLMENASGVRSKFFEGMLQTAGGSFDGVSFHAYDNINDNPGAGDVSVGRYSWRDFSNQSNGPALVAKTRFLKQRLAAAGITGKFFMNTEVAIIKFGASLSGSAFTVPSREQTKANYVPQSYAAAIAEGLVANIWYDLGGWNGSGLINTQAYTAMKVAQAKLGRAVYLGPVTAADVGGAQNVLGYKFSVNGKQMWVAWTHDGVERGVTFGQAPSAVTDPVGQSIGTTGVKLGVKPLYIEF